jgi:hypothetical protein
MSILNNLLQEAPPFRWTTETYQEHIESVLTLTGEYRGQTHRLRREAAPGNKNQTHQIYRLYWTKNNRDYLIHFFLEIDQAIREFIKYEPIKVEED